ncbi:hypothetical protein [Phyllobacterium sp. P30BS-XVII]|nr:hypothetical protein [Phyllobacterium sp. P30BS-XVII]MBA8900397.1 hypothetical protein [Phyllobacterium sp. P30BS-XVII]
MGAICLMDGVWMVWFVVPGSWFNKLTMRESEDETLIADNC